MKKIRFHEIKKAIIKDFCATADKKWNGYFGKPFIADIKRCVCTEEIIQVLMQNGFTYGEALEQINDLITTR